MTTKDTALHKGLRVLKLLPGHALNGLSNQDLARATGLSPSGITRILQALIDEGMAEKHDNGRYGPGMRLMQMAAKTEDEFNRASLRMQEIRARIDTGVHH